MTDQPKTKDEHPDTARRNKESAVAKSFERIMIARAAILSSGAKPRTAGVLDCPICNKNKLKWSMASNNHIHAHCSTVGCVSWME